MPIPRCQSKNRRSGGCGDPRCPENLYIQNALVTAIRHGDIDGFMRARQVASVKSSDVENFDVLTISERSGEVKKFFGLPVGSPKMVSRDFLVPSVHPASLVDKSEVKAFGSFSQASKYVKFLYGDSVQLNMMADYPVQGFANLGNIFVNKDARGLGVGRHIISMLKRASDINGQVISLTPANSEEGRINQGNTYTPEKDAAYRGRLEKYYQSLGFVFVRDVRSQITEQAYRSIRAGGSMVYFPNNVIPKNILKNI